jgi:uncharacterized protein (DUF983 family)
MPYTTSKDISFGTIIRRGLRRRCPNCGEGRSFSGYLTVADACKACGESLGHIRADDFPPYLTILIVGHIVVPLSLMAEQSYNWSTKLHMAVWLPMTLVLMLMVLPVMKGAVVSLMWHLGLTGNEQH